MSYQKAEQVLPEEILRLIQQYVDGACLYIPRKENERKTWGQETKIRQELNHRNKSIYEDYKNGYKVTRLAEKYYLSVKSIQRILKQMKSIS